MTLPANSFHGFKYILIFISFLVFFCNRETAPDIDEKEFIEVYARFLIINELRAADSLKTRYQDQLLAENSMTREDLKNSIAFFRNDPQRWVVILEQLRDRIKNLKTAMPQDTTMTAEEN